jgi:serine/threonine-protein kinase
MPDSLWNRLAEIVPAALDEPAERREAFLDAACTDADGVLDRALRDEAAALVQAAADADASGALHSPLAALAPPPHRLPERVGPWKIAGLLGEGGMGVVYRAERDDGLFERAVALKRIRPGLGRLLAGRLDAERAVLARLDHPGIARLYDGALDDDGVPYVVMELVEGVPITDHAEAHGLSVADRVGLFAQVCDAVAYAHQNLVVHRDLKPSNVFVTPDGRPKLLDFGIAKLLDDDDRFSETLTRTQAALTPSYAAPEQIRRGAITTATDVYALGVMLFELLAGQRPYSLADTTPAEAERVVCETVPPALSAVAPEPRRRALRGDLDTIVERAMAKEPERRYASAEALAADLRRHLDGVPVEARPATVAYRVGRFVRRHRAGVAAASVAALAVVGGAGAAVWQAGVARSEAAQSAAVSDFLVGLLNAPNAEVDGRDVRVVSLLDQAAADLDSAFSGDAATEAALRHTLGTSYRSLGLYDQAERQLDAALALRRRAGQPVDVAEVHESLGRLYTERGEYAAADSVLSLALAAYRLHLPAQHERLSYALNDLGKVRYETGEYAAAASLWREALDIDEATKPPGHLDRLVGMENLALALYDGGDTTGGLALMERQLAMLRQYHPANDLTLGNSLANLGSLYAGAGRPDRALPLQREAVARFRRLHGDRHPDVAFGMGNLGATLGQLERHAEAVPILRAAAALYGAAFGTNYADHPDVGYPLVNLAKSLRDLGQRDEAAAAARRAQVVFTAAFGADHPTTARATEVLASLGAR